jgi:hypothetical protein
MFVGESKDCLFADMNSDQCEKKKTSLCSSKKSRGLRESIGLACTALHVWGLQFLPFAPSWCSKDFPELFY